MANQFFKLTTMTNKLDSIGMQTNEMDVSLILAQKKTIYNT